MVSLLWINKKIKKKVQPKGSELKGVRTMSRKYIDCRDYPQDNKKCTVAISADSTNVVSFWNVYYFAHQQPSGVSGLKFDERCAVPSLRQSYRQPQPLGFAQFGQETFRKIIIGLVERLPSKCFK